MQKIIFILLFFIFHVNAQEENNLSLEKQIDQAFQMAMIKKDANILHTLTKKLQNHVEKTPQHPYLTYWAAYGLYFQAIYEKMIAENVDKAQEHIDLASDVLKNKKQKTAEDYALLARITVFSVGLAGKNMFALMYRIKKFNGYIEKSEELNPNNPRLWFVQGEFNYYSPATFGGGAQVEEFMTKAIALPNKNADIYAPSWGQLEAYEMLIRYYLKEKNTAAAEEKLKIALANFPNEEKIKALAEKLKNL